MQKGIQSEIRHSDDVNDRYFQTWSGKEYPLIANF